MTAAAPHPNPLAPPEFPSASDPRPAFAGFAFDSAPPPAAPGVFVLALEVEGAVYPALVGEGDDLAAALAKAGAEAPPLAGTLRRFWLARESARQRAHVARDLIRKFNPPLNAEGRSARAPQAVAALAPDLAADAFPPLAVESAAVSEEAIAACVRAFYDAGRKDPVIGPVFNGAVSDWDGHIRIVEDFWSKTLLGTTRYEGMPFPPHLRLRLRQEHFDRWVALFRETATAELPAEAARLAILKVEMMSRCFQAGLVPLAGPQDVARPGRNAAA